MLAAAFLAFGFCLALLSVGADWPKEDAMPIDGGCEQGATLAQLVASFVYLKRLQ